MSRTVSSIVITLVRTVILLALALILGASIMGGTLAAREQALAGADTGDGSALAGSGAFATAEAPADDFFGRLMTFARYFFQDLVVVSRTSPEPGSGPQD